MGRVCVVINDIGGIPYALHRNVTSAHAWVDAVHENVGLSHTNTYTEFRNVVHITETTTLFKVVRERGVPTVLLGSSGGLRQQPNPLEDSRQSLLKIGVDVCSPYDDASFVGTSDAHDDQIMYDAIRILDESKDSQDLFLWINMLALRDMNHHATNHHDHRYMDRRQIPDSLHTIVSGVTDVVGTNSDITTMRRTLRNAENEYLSLLEASKARLSTHLERIKRILVSIMDHHPDAHICHTASHSLALGEHGMRGSNTPMCTTCSTFFASRPGTPRANTLECMLYNFVHSAFSIPHPTQTGHPITRVDVHPYVRVLVTLNDHTYAVVLVNNTIHNVFDISTDPFETSDVYGSVEHLRYEMCQIISRLNPTSSSSPMRRPSPMRRRPSPLRRPSPVIVPSSPSPRALSPTESISSVASSIVSTTSTRRSVSVRQAEQRLNKLHR